MHNAPNFNNLKAREIIIENGVSIKVDPIVHVGYSPKRKTDLTELVNLILEKEQKVRNEIEDNKALALTFEQWQAVIDIEKQIISDRKQVFQYQEKYYDNQRQIVILTWKQ